MEFETDSIGLSDRAALRKICLTERQFETDQGQSRCSGIDRLNSRSTPFRYFVAIALAGKHHEWRQRLSAFQVAWSL